MIIIIALLGCGPMASAGPIQDGLVAIHLGDFPTALKVFRPLAEQGDADAQFYLGAMYSEGNGVLQDYKEALKWFRKGADQGQVSAQFALGEMFAHGKGLVQNDKEAVKWYRLAAEQGLDFAQHDLGLMFQDGRGVPQDYVRAHMWVNLAAPSLSGDIWKKAADNRNRIAAAMTPTQIERAQEMARKCKQSNFKNCGW